jgi:hypothetical protein
MSSFRTKDQENLEMGMFILKIIPTFGRLHVLFSCPYRVYIPNTLITPIEKIRTNYVQKTWSNI